MIYAAYTPSTTAVGSSLALTALLGLLPLVVFFVLLGVFKVKTHVCAIISLAAALAAAIFAFGMPVDLALLSATQGAAFGLFPIVYIVIMAVWLYNLTEKTGRSEDVRRVFAAVGKGDVRVQALLIGFCFCGLMEGLAGFGAPVAISCAMLLALGVPAIKAALATMVGNALNVCFGAMAIPVTTAAKLGSSSADAVGATQGRITPLFLCWIPVLLLGILDGKRGMKQAWPAALVAGVTMGLGHIVAANFLSYELTAVFASLLSFASVTLLLRVWRPRTPEEQLSETSSEKLSGSRVALGLLPYWLVVVIFAVAKLWTAGIDVPKALESTDVAFGWPGLDGQLLGADGQAVKATQFTFSWLSSPGTMLLLTGLIVAVVYGKNSSGGKHPFSFGKGMATLWKTVIDLKLAILARRGGRGVRIPLAHPRVGRNGSDRFGDVGRRPVRESPVDGGGEGRNQHSTALGSQRNRRWHRKNSQPPEPRNRGHGDQGARIRIDAPAQSRPLLDRFHRTARHDRGACFERDAGVPHLKLTLGLPVKRRRGSGR